MQRSDQKGHCPNTDAVVTSLTKLKGSNLTPLRHP